MPPAKAGCPRTVIKGAGTALPCHTQWCQQRLPKVLGKPVVHALPDKNNPSLRSCPFEPVEDSPDRGQGQEDRHLQRLARSLLTDVFTVAHPRGT